MLIDQESESPVGEKIPKLKLMASQEQTSSKDLITKYEELLE